jgi:hypothetical protein
MDELWNIFKESIDKAAQLRFAGIDDEIAWREALQEVLIKRGLTIIKIEHYRDLLFRAGFFDDLEDPSDFAG